MDCAHTVMSEADASKGWRLATGHEESKSQDRNGNQRKRECLGALSCWAGLSFAHRNKLLTLDRWQLRHQAHGQE